MISKISKSIGAKIIEVPKNKGVTIKPKLVDFSEVDIYPSKYKYIDGKVIIKSLIIEDIARQQALLNSMNTTVLIGDHIKVDFKFGHFENNDWIDLYVNGIYRVKRIIPRMEFCEILLIVNEVI